MKNSGYTLNEKNWLHNRKQRKNVYWKPICMKQSLIYCNKTWEWNRIQHIKTIFHICQSKILHTRRFHGASVIFHPNSCYQLVSHRKCSRVGGLATDVSDFQTRILWSFLFNIVSLFICNFLVSLLNCVCI